MGLPDMRLALLIGIVLILLLSLHSLFVMYSRLGKARERLLQATGEYALPHGAQLDEITGVRKQTRVREMQFKVRDTAPKQGVKETLTLPCLTHGPWFISRVKSWGLCREDYYQILIRDKE